MNRAYSEIRDAAADWLAEMPQAIDFMGGVNIRDLPPGPLPAPKPYPSGCKLFDLPAAASPAAATFCQAIQRNAEHLHWTMDYEIGQPGITQAFLDGCTYFELTGPSAPFIDQKNRITVGYWNSGLEYLNHWHEPEELYCIAAGQVMFAKDDGEFELVSAGETVFHASNQPHRIKMNPTGLLAIVIWRGDGLNDRPAV